MAFGETGSTQEIPNVGLSTCNGTMLQCSNDGTDAWRRDDAFFISGVEANFTKHFCDRQAKDPCEAQEDCMKIYHGCGDGFVQCSLDAPWSLVAVAPISGAAFVHRNY